MLRFAALALFLLLTAPVAAAQDTTDYSAFPRFDIFDFRIGGGANYAVDRLGDFLDFGYHGTAEVDIRFVGDTPEAAAALSFAYYLFPDDNDRPGDINILTGTVGLRLTPQYPDPSRFYILAGGGYGRVGLVDDSSGRFLIGREASQSGLLAELGLGVELKESSVGYFIELRGMNIFSKDFGDYRFGRLTIGVLF